MAADVLPKGRTAAAAPAGERRLAVHPRTLTLPWYFFTGAASVPHCGERRPLRAPLLELAMIAAFVLIAWRFSADPRPHAPVYWLYAWFLLTVLVIDLEHRLVLNVMTLPAAVLALAASFLPWRAHAGRGAARRRGRLRRVLPHRPDRPGRDGHGRRQAGRRDRPDGRLPARGARPARWV